MTQCLRAARVTLCGSSPTASSSLPWVPRTQKSTPIIDTSSRTPRENNPCVHAWCQNFTDLESFSTNASILDVLNTVGLRLGRSEVLRSLRHYIPAGTKPRTSHLRSPGGERRRKRKRSTTIFLERTEKGPSSNQTNIGTVPKGNIGKTPERRGGAFVCLLQRIDTILN